MIVPLGINHVIRGWPLVTLSIIATCVLVQVYSDTVAPSPEEVHLQIVERLGELPFDATEAQQEEAADDVVAIANRIPQFRLGYQTGSGISYRLVTSAFVHAGWWHLIGNMLFLWLVGATLEDKWGRAKFAAFFVFGAAASALCFDFMHDGEMTLLIGASGAISALMGAFLVNFARMQIHFVYWIGIRAGTFNAAAYIALPLWLFEQLFYAWLENSIGNTSGIAFTAHIGGFGAGLAAALVARYVGQRASTGAVDADLPGPDRAELPRAKAKKRRRPTAAEPEPAPAAAPAARVGIEPPKQEAPPDPGSGPRFLR